MPARNQQKSRAHVVSGRKAKDARAQNNHAQEPAHRTSNSAQPDSQQATVSKGKGNALRVVLLVLGSVERPRRRPRRRPRLLAARARRGAAGRIRPVPAATITIRNQCLVLEWPDNLFRVEIVPHKVSDQDRGTRTGMAIGSGAANLEGGTHSATASLLLLPPPSVRIAAEKSSCCRPTWLSLAL